MDAEEARLLARGILAVVFNAATLGQDQLPENAVGWMKQIVMLHMMRV